MSSERLYVLRWVIRRAALACWILVATIVAVSFADRPSHWVSAGDIDLGGCLAEPEQGCASVHGAWTNRRCDTPGETCQTCVFESGSSCFPDSETCNAETCAINHHKPVGGIH